MKHFFAGFALLLIGIWTAAQAQSPSVRAVVLDKLPAPAAVGNWLPTSAIGTLEYWYKADTGVFSDTGCTTPATNGGTVGCWQDQSSNGFTQTQPTAGARPTFTTGVINGLPGVGNTTGSNAGLGLKTANMGASLTGSVMSFVGFVTGSGFSHSTYLALMDNGASVRLIHYSSQGNAGQNPGSLGGYDGSFLGSTGAGNPLSASTGYYSTIVYTGLNTASSCIRLKGVDITNGGACAGNLGGGNVWNSTEPLCILGDGVSCGNTADSLWDVEIFMISGNNATDQSNGEAYLKSRMGL